MLLSTFVGAFMLRDDASLPLLIIFDWDCTLVNTPGHFDHEEDLRSYYMSQVDSGVISVEDIKRVPDGFWSFMLPLHRDIEDPASFKMAHSDEIYSYFADKVKMAIVSNKIQWVVEEEAKWLGLGDGRFCSVIGGDVRENAKPSAANLLLAAKQCGAEGEAIWVVGDSFIDMQAARNAGYVPVFYSYNGGSQEINDIYNRAMDHYLKNYYNMVDDGFIDEQIVIADLLDLINVYDELSWSDGINNSDTVGV